MTKIAELANPLALALEALALHTDQIQQLHNRLAVIERAMQLARQHQEQPTGAEVV